MGMICAPIKTIYKEKKSSCGVGSPGEIESLCWMLGILVIAVD